jgi:hypothetical protein
MFVLCKDSSMEHEGQKGLKKSTKWIKEKKIPGQSRWDLWWTKWH